MHNQEVVPDQLMNLTGLFTKVTGDHEAEGLISHLRKDVLHVLEEKPKHQKDFGFLRCL